VIQSHGYALIGLQNCLSSSYSLNWSIFALVLHPLVPLCSCLTRSLLQLTSSGMLWKSTEFSITPAKVTPVHAAICTEVTMLQCWHGASGEVDKSHAYRMPNQNHYIINGVAGCLGPFVLTRFWNTCYTWMERTNSSWTVTDNFNCLITCHIWGRSLLKGLFCSQILVEWLKIVIGFRPPESYDDFWTFQFCLARRMALYLG